MVLTAAGRMRGITVWLVLLAIAFVLGTAAGSLYVNALSPERLGEAAARLGTALDRFQQGDGVSAGDAALRAAAFNLKTAGILWLLGLTVFGIPAVFAVIFARGFILGFSVGFLIREEGWRGILFSAGALLPSHLLAVPLLFAVGVLAIAFALYRRGRLPGGGWGGEFVRYTALTGILAACLGLAGMLDGYVGRALAAYLLQ